MFYGQYFVTLLCRACARTRGLISRPGLAYTVFCGSRLEAEFMAIIFFVARLCRAFDGIRGLISLNLSRTVFCGSRAFFHGNFLLRDSVGRLLVAGA